MFSCFADMLCAYHVSGVCLFFDGSARRHALDMLELAGVRCLISKTMGSKLECNPSRPFNFVNPGPVSSPNPPKRRFASA